MSYLVEIPEEVKPQIIEAVQEVRRKLITPIRPMNFLMRIYYRYVEQLGKYKNVEEKIKFQFGCSACRQKVLKFFEQQIQLWN